MTSVFLGSPLFHLWLGQSLMLHLKMSAVEFSAPAVRLPPERPAIPWVGLYPQPAIQV